MGLRNDPGGFGWLTRWLHWGIALAVLGQLVLGTVIAGMQVNLSNLWLFSLHKSIGVSVLALMVLRLIWHRISPVPAPLANVPRWQIGLARATHVAFYALLIAVPLTGWVASGASGLDVVVFGDVVLPPLTPPSIEVEDWFLALHGGLTKVLMALVVLHIAGGAKRGLAGDGTLSRMVRGR